VSEKPIETTETLFQLDGGNNSSDQDGNYANTQLPADSWAAAPVAVPQEVIPTPVREHREFKVAPIIKPPISTAPPARSADGH
jgi:hypothetical protein